MRNQLYIAFLALMLTIGTYGIGIRSAIAEEGAHENHDHGEVEKSEQHHSNTKVNQDEHEEESGHGNHEGHTDHGTNENKSHESHEGHADGEPEGHDDHEGHDEHSDEPIKLDEEARSMIQLQTEKVLKQKLGGKLKVYGKIAQDAEHYSYVTFDGEGRVEKIHVGLGTVIEKGDPVLSIRRDNGMVENVNANMHGAVLSIFVKPGERIDRLTSLISIVDIDTMRATIDIYEKDLRFINVGQKVNLLTAAFPGKTFEGEVVYISPQVDEHTQSIKVRIDVKNPDHFLRLGMFVEGELLYASDKTALAVPSAAVQQLNEEDIVFVAEKEDAFELREVVLGQKSNDFIEVKKGLKEGEIVVTQGSFYLKSEQAKEAFGDGHAH